MKFPFLKQPDMMECGATCLRMICKYYGKSFGCKTAQQVCQASQNGISMMSLLDAAEYWGFRTVCGRLSLEKLVAQRPFPCILHWNQEHFVVLYDVKKKKWEECLLCCRPG